MGPRRGSRSDPGPTPRGSEAARRHGPGPHPGDLLHGDANGITTIPNEIASDVAQISEEYVEAEEAYRAAIEIDDELWRAYNGLGCSALNRWLLSDRTDEEAKMEARDAFRASLQLNMDQAKVIRLMLEYGMRR